MKNKVLRIILTFIATLFLFVLTIGSAVPASAGTNGQQLTIRANSNGFPGFTGLTVSGTNNANRSATWTWNGGQSYEVSTTNWWWKGTVTIQAKYANGASKSCSANVPTIQVSNFVVTTCSSDVPSLPPAAPSNARLDNITVNAMTLRWNDNAGNVNGEQGFKIERRNGGGWSPIATASANTTSYTSSGLSAGTQYYFRVRAYNSFGDSGYSNETCATTPKKRIGIQAGHWKVNELPAELAWGRAQTGTSGGGTTEWQVTLNVANLAANLLRQRGFDVDVLPATVPEQYKPDVFVSLHTDGNASPNPNGFKASRSYYTTNTSASDRLVNAIYTEYGKSTRLTVATNITDDMRYYYAFNYATYKHAIGKDVPAALLEMGYLSSPTDQQILVKNQNLAAEGVANAISAFFK